MLLAKLLRQGFVLNLHGLQIPVMLLAKLFVLLEQQLDLVLDGCHRVGLHLVPWDGRFRHLCLPSNVDHERVWYGSSFTGPHDGL